MLFFTYTHFKVLNKHPSCEYLQVHCNVAQAFKSRETHMEYVSLALTMYIVRYNPKMLFIAMVH